MKRVGNTQIQDLACEQATPLRTDTKYVTVAIFEKAGKTVLQPLMNEQETKQSMNSSEPKP